MTTKTWTIKVRETVERIYLLEGATAEEALDYYIHGLADHVDERLLHAQRLSAPRLTHTLAIDEGGFGPRGAGGAR